MRSVSRRGVTNCRPMYVERSLIWDMSESPACVCPLARCMCNDHTCQPNPSTGSPLVSGSDVSTTVTFHCTLMLAKHLCDYKTIFKQVLVNCRHFTRDANYRPSGGPGTLILELTCICLEKMGNPKQSEDLY